MGTMSVVKKFFSFFVLVLVMFFSVKVGLCGNYNSVSVANQNIIPQINKNTLMQGKFEKKKVRLVGNGYAEFSNGVIMQWGYIRSVPISEGQYRRYYFNKPFPHGVFSIIITPQYQDMVLNVTSWDNKSFVLHGENYHNPYGLYYNNVFWIAIGY